MERLTIWNDKTEGAELMSWDEEEWKDFIGSLDVPICTELSLAVDKLAEYEDAEEQGLLLKKEKAVDEGYLYDWYIHSVTDDEPIWTEAHIEELFNDFILIPKEEAK